MKLSEHKLEVMAGASTVIVSLIMLPVSLFASPDQVTLDDNSTFWDTSSNNQTILSESSKDPDSSSANGMSIKDDSKKEPGDKESSTETNISKPGGLEVNTGTDFDADVDIARDLEHPLEAETDPNVPFGEAIPDRSITNSKIRDGAITSEKIKDGSIRIWDIGRGAITDDKLNAEIVKDLVITQRTESSRSAIPRYGGSGPVYAYCEPGETIIGGGMVKKSSGDILVLTENGPFDAGTYGTPVTIWAWGVQAINLGIGKPSDGFDVYAICMKIIKHELK